MPMLSRLSPVTAQLLDLPPTPPKWANHYDWVRWCVYVERNGLLPLLSEPKQVAVSRVVRRELEERKRHSGHPLRFVELWRPECHECIDWTWPMREDKGGVVNFEGKPCGKRRPGSRGLRVHGVVMEPLGNGVHRCPVCGVEEQRTSQLEAVRQILSTLALIFVLIGGNRSSKSVTGRIITIIFACGTDDPHVAEMLRRNGVEAPRVQADPRMVYSGAITNADSRDYVRPGYAALLPEWSWQNKGGTGDAMAWPPGCGPAQPGCIAFKSCDAGAKRWQGASVPIINIDESHADVVLLNEQEMRTADVGGLILVTATPTRGMDDMFADIFEREPEPRPAGDVARYVLDPLDNPFIHQEAMARKFAGMSERARRVKRFGEFVKLEGLVFPQWDPQVHVVPALPLEEMAGWPRADGLDFGFRAPTAYVWSAIAPDGVLHIYRVWYQSGLSADKNVEAIYQAEMCPDCWEPPRVIGDLETIEFWERHDQQAAQCETCNGTGRRWDEPYVRAADPAQAGEFARWVELGVSITMADKARKQGFELLDQLLTVQEDGKPGLVVHDHPSTAPLREELAGLAYKKDSVDGAQVKASKETELDPRCPDHAFDALRYLAMGARHHGLIRPIHEDDS